MGERRPTSTLSARAERRAMLALVTVFALLVQMLAPAAAVAAPATDPLQQVICTDHGLQTITTPGDPAPTKSAPGHGCGHCVCPPTAAEPPAILAPTAFISYARPARPLAAVEGVPPPARAPPRPPGQGPPTSNA